jgi:copper chaperone CopZ
MLIQMDVGALPGVVSATADHRSGIAEVTYDADVLGPDDIISAIVALGYGAEKAEV